jgi:hypothetical protein
MTASFLVAELDRRGMGKLPVPRTRRPLIPTQGTVAPPAELSRV